MAANYIPATDAGLDSWGANFASLITAAPATYGLDAVAALAIQNAQDTYHAAFLVGGSTNRVPNNPTTYSPTTVAAKDAAKIAARSLFRAYASQIRLNPGVTNGDKIALGLNLPNNVPSPIPAPTSFPLLTFLSGTALAHQFSYKDSDTPVGKAKAPGAVQMQLYGNTSPTVVTDPAALLLHDVVTKSPFLVLWDSSDGGKIAYYAARWVTRRGLVGPWSAITAQTVLPA